MDGHELAMAVAVGITEAMASQTWQGLRAKIAQALGRGDEARSRRRGEALDRHRAQVVAARRTGDKAAEAAVRDHWASRIEELLEDDAGRETALRELLAQLPAPKEPAARQIYQQAFTGRGDNYQAGGDQTIDQSRHRTKRGGAGPMAVVVVLLLILGGVGGAVYYSGHHGSDGAGGSYDPGADSAVGGTSTGGSGGVTETPTQGTGASGGGSGAGGSDGVPAAALSAGINGVSGASTCGQWLAADESTQYAVVQRVSVAENSPMASNPFPVQEMKYDCQNNMQVSVARVIWDIETPHESSTT